MLAESDRRLLPLLPLVYVAWADGELTPDEAALVRAVGQRIGAPDAALDRWLDPDAPPDAEALGRLARWLGAAAGEVGEAGDLAELGLALAAAHGIEDAGHADAVRDVADKLGLRGAADAVGELRPPPRVEGFGEIEAPSFDPAPLTAWLEAAHPADRAAVRALIAEPDFTHRYDVPIEAQRAQVTAWLGRVAAAGIGRRAFPQVEPDGALGRFVAAFETLALFDLGLTIKCGVQFGLFGGSIAALGTAKHHARLEAVADLSLPGCFAMTERGHGSNVRALETTATWDGETGEFVVHTPHDGARKEWIGNAARDGRMATVFAQLVVGEAHHGVHALLVPIRDDAGRLCPGVRIADCGPKMGLDGVDNGQIWFDRVRVPRENLLDRFAQVDAEGRYHSEIQSAGKRFFTMVGTLVGGRVCIAGAAVSVAKVALAIAVRYGARRRQFGPKGAEEVLILDHPAHQRRLLPRLARTYALACAQQVLAEKFVSHDPEAQRDVEALAAGLKAIATWHATDTVQAARECCGGQGYAARNRFAALKADSDVFATFEGDNTVLLQLVARSLLTEFQSQFADSRVYKLVRYLAGRAATAAFDRNPLVAGRTGSKHLRDDDWQRTVIEARQADLTDSLSRRLRRRLGEGMDPFVALGELQNHMLALARAWVEAVVLRALRAAVARCEGPERAVLDDLADLHALSVIEADLSWFQENGYLDGGKARAVRDEVEALCAALRPHAVALVDAFAIPDKCLAPIALAGEAG
ncbi:MAG: acyl-CoA dehydrogenase [bacterium]